MQRTGFGLTLCVLWGVAATTLAQSTVTSISPKSLRPGESAKLTLHGKDLKEPLRLHPSEKQLELVVEKVEPTQAVVNVSVPADMPLGPTLLWPQLSDGPAAAHILIVDDLPTVQESDSNNSRETAQPISNLSAVDGVSSGAKSDFFKLQVQKGERLSIEVLTQPLGSAMDPLVKLLDSHGKLLRLVDDEDQGPECRFTHSFEEAGDVFLEVRDSRYVAGNAYHLRIGDFPVLSGIYPPVAERGKSTSLRFLDQAGEVVASSDVSVPTEFNTEVKAVSAKRREGKSSAWGAVRVSGSPQFVEPSDSSEPGSISTIGSLPVGISGCLTKVKERDGYKLRASKGQIVRFASRTRSIGSPTALVMQLFNSQNAKVAETAVSESDEWSFDYTFPEDGEFRLEVSDLLGRGGPGFLYWIDVKPAGEISLALKADAKSVVQYAMEPEVGGAALDVQVARFGYEGPVRLFLGPESKGLRIVNPLIGAKANEAKVYIVATSEWSPSSGVVDTLYAEAVDKPEIRSTLSLVAWQRIKQPHLLVPDRWGTSSLSFGGTSKIDRPYALEPATPIQFARPVKSHPASLVLKRTVPEFKGTLTLLNDPSVAGWTASTKVDKDTYNLTLVRSAENNATPDAVTVLAYSEFKGHGRIDSLTVPFEWIDPVRFEFQPVKNALVGGVVPIRFRILRQGNDPQPVTLKPASLPPGITTTTPSVTIPANQSEGEILLQVGADVPVSQSVALSFDVSSKYAGTDFSLAVKSEPFMTLPSPKSIQVYPSEIALQDAKSRQQLVVTEIGADGQVRDWTREAQIVVANKDLAEVRGTVLFPKADGATELMVSVGTSKQIIPVRIASAKSQRPPAFETEVLVALSKQGCNSGACHGSPSGKGGFRLSLRAFDKKLDELTMIREDFGRRVNVLEPEKSLLLLKPLMKVTHGGGKQIQKNDEAYAILRDWMASGAKMDSADAPRCVKLEVTPKSKQVLDLQYGVRQLAATAVFSDGSRRDVSHLVAYESSNNSVATVDKFGLVSARARGESVILVRFLEHIESVPLMFVDEVDGFDWKAPPTNNYVDVLIDEKLKQLQYLPAEVCSDSEFLRRVYLDVIGALPSLEETQSFLADSSTTKRARIIDELLNREEYPKFWALKWGDLLKMTSKAVGDDGVYKYHRWVEEAFRTNMPYDQFAYALLTASGSTLSNPPANFYRTSTDMNESVETISQVFMGARLQCAKCHNHPFERWTQDNYYGLGAFFQRTSRKKTQRPGEMLIYTGTSGEVTQPRTGQVMKPWLPQVGTIEPTENEDRREAFAKWLINPDNPYFAKIEANRIWSQLFARGIVDPIDDFRDSNPPANEALLDSLAKDFVKSGYDRKHLLRVILNSRTYQASCQTNRFNEEDTLYFSHQEPRLLGAEQLLDAVNKTVGLQQTFGNLPIGTLATHLPAPDVVKVDFLKVFGQPERSTVCACERADDSNLGMAIELFNGAMIHEKLRDANNRFRKSLAAGKDLESIVRELYLAAVCREPLAAELETALAHCKKREDLAAGLEDLCWALLNTDEFLFQH